MTTVVNELKPLANIYQVNVNVTLMVENAIHYISKIMTNVVVSVKILKNIMLVKKIIFEILLHVVVKMVRIIDDLVITWD